jgi:hypothetical protein
MRLDDALKRILFVLGLLGVGMFSLLDQAQAVPSFARQTGFSCTTCHTVFPELTPMGRIFKLTGYTFSKDWQPYQLTPPPLTAEAQISFTHLQKDLPQRQTFLGIRGNDNIQFPQLLNFYYAGQVVSKLGAFVQTSYVDLNRHFILSKADGRVATTVFPGGKDLIIGMTYNNYPTLQDVWNTTPAWSFPYLRSFVAPAPAITLLQGSLATQAGGLGAYFLWNNLIYGELTFYRTAANGFTQPLSAGVVTTTFVDGVAPYWRLVLQHVRQQHNFSVGTYGMVTNLYLGRTASGPSNQFIDIGFDAQYQYITPKHIVSAQVNWIYESQDLTASYNRFRAQYPSEFLSAFQINVNYHYRSFLGTVGGIVQFFATNGSSDSLRSGPFPVYGSLSSRPNTSGFILQGDYLPLDRIKISVQYVIYQQFNGSSTNYDGFGRNAADNNTLYIYARLLI